MTFKQLLQLDAIDVTQIDSCRVSGINELLAIMLMSAKFGKPVCPHAGGVGLCEYVIHLSLIDYIAVSGDMTRNVLEFVEYVCLLYLVLFSMFSVVDCPLRLRSHLSSRCNMRNMEGCS